jgi:hypothetical protein
MASEVMVSRLLMVMIVDGHDVRDLTPLGAEDLLQYFERNDPFAGNGGSANQRCDC